MTTRFAILKARELVDTYGLQAVDLATLEGAHAITRGDLLLARRWADTLAAVENLLAARARRVGSTEPLPTLRLQSRKPG